MINSSCSTTLAKKIYEEIFYLEPLQDKIDLDGYCEKKLKIEFPNLSDPEIADELENILEKVKFRINKRKEYCEKQCIAPEYELAEYPPNLLLHYSFKYNEPPLLSFLRKQNRQVLKGINEMSWDSFEYLCKHLLEINGVKPLTLTKRNQEGIDFCGLYDIGSYTTYSSSMIIPKTFTIKIVGQVKHYPIEKIKPREIKSFSTYCDDVKNEKERVIKKLPTWFNEAKRPVLGVFITLSAFTRGTIGHSENEWIVLRDGEQVVEDIIKSPYSENWVKSIGEKLTFDKESFLKSFEKNNT
ncbi:hypothetical protein BEH94_11700 [Candidatus Altiarchaeales archaeon WOR_SM1_SCG]|nr:hypothetical protein BEH94_11700 [Candidatus Altiarchaeales archaeon WOR_SM1_SCG]